MSTSLSPQSRTKRLLLRILLILAIVASVGYYLYYAIRYQHLHVPVLNWFQQHEQDDQHWNQPALHEDSFPLQDYRLTYSRTIPQIEKNLSGLSYMEDQQTLLAVLNRPPTILELNLQGDIQATYPLDGISDTEGISYLGNGQVALSNEKHGRIVLAQLPEQPGRLDLKNAPKLSLGPADSDNGGLEGLGYDHIRDLLYVVKEHSPKGLFRLHGLCAEKPTCSFDNIHIEDISHWVESLDFIHDLSSVIVEPERGHIILLSEQNQALLELDDHGEPRSYRALNYQHNDQNIPQAEGITLGPNGHLYLVSEPNLFYVFTR